MSKQYLNYFRPHPSPEGAENQLTRAALALMRLVPLVHNEFLRRALPAKSLSDLPPADFDTQTSQLHPTLEGAIASDSLEDEQPTVVSVFLAPDRSDLTFKVTPSDRRAVFDGVIRYGNELILVIESKLHEGIDPRQAEEIPLGPLAGHCQLQADGVPVRWDELFAAWQDLSELGVLAYSERRLLEDFFDIAKRSYGSLLPFDTLARAADNEELIRLRVRDILEAASGMEVSSEWVGWKAIGSWRTFERFVLGVPHQEPLRLALYAWPGVKKPEAQKLYGQPGLLQSLLNLNETATSSADFRFLPDFSVQNYRPNVTQWPHTQFDTVEEYVSFWRDHTDAIWRRKTTDDVVSLFEWLVQHRLAERDNDWPKYEATFASLRSPQVDVRPALRVDAVWSLADATALDSKHQLVDEVRRTMNAILEALGEDPLERVDDAESLA